MSRDRASLLAGAALLLALSSLVISVLAFTTARSHRGGANIAAPIDVDTSDWEHSRRNPDRKIDLEKVQRLRN